MKRIVWISAAVLLFGGFVSSVQAQNMIGTWQGTFSWASLGGGESGYGSGIASLHVTNQVGGLFIGYFVPPGSNFSDTNSVAGIFQVSLQAPGSFDVNMSISGGEDRGGAATGVLSTNGTPKISRAVFVRPGSDLSLTPQESLTAGGKLIKISSTP